MSDRHKQIVVSSKPSDRLYFCVYYLLFVLAEVFFSKIPQFSLNREWNSIAPLAHHLEISNYATSNREGCLRLQFANRMYGTANYMVRQQVIVAVVARPNLLA